MEVPHVRVSAPKGTFGKLSSSRGSRFYLTLPGQKEQECVWIQGTTLRMNVNEPTIVVIELLASLEVRDDA